jgi:hypothetical protein
MTTPIRIPMKMKAGAPLEEGYGAAAALWPQLHSTRKPDIGDQQIDAPLLLRASEG